MGKIIQHFRDNTYLYKGEFIGIKCKGHLYYLESFIDIEELPFERGQSLVHYKNSRSYNEIISLDYPLLDFDEEALYLNIWGTEIEQDDKAICSDIIVKSLYFKQVLKKQLFNLISDWERVIKIYHG